MPAAKAMGFTLIELLVAMALMAVIIPVIYKGLQVATLAGEVSQRKALAARIAERVMNETIVNGQTQTATSGAEQAGPYQFRWTVKDEPWAQLSTMTTGNTANSVNQSVVNENTIHQLSVSVTYGAQGKDYSVQLSTLINATQP